MIPQMGDSLEGSENTPETQNVAVVDFTAFTNFILKAATVLLPEDDSQAEPTNLVAALDDKTNQEYIRKFISDPQVATLYIQRNSSKGNYLSHPSLTDTSNLLTFCMDVGCNQLDHLCLQEIYVK
ncbi:hypothetical protein NQ314_012961 [Rhamnusium bicolor]|uniref:Uncharacterized protein n=1 Tax=Rhamnusium bicolor TaxID=1586634 RepID=A0AAV8X875_9CUCU|nr:hypothetical protein NQ314_012961 [Rhamnusium bicolor]